MSTLQQANVPPQVTVISSGRLSLADIEGAIVERYDLLGHQAVNNCYATGLVPSANHPLGLLSICILVMRNGFTVIGKSTPAPGENFNAELGCRFAYEDALRQLWPLLGYNLRQKLYEAADEGLPRQRQKLYAAADGSRP